MKYEVVVFCEGAWSFDIEAEDEDCAMDIAREKFYKLPAEDIVVGIDITDYDIYEHAKQVAIYRK